MASKTETDIEELRNLILALDTKIEKRFDQQEKRIDNLETTIKVGFTEVKGDFKRLDERINGVEKRLDDTRLTLESKINDTRSTLESQISVTNARLNAITIGFFGMAGILMTGLLTILSKVVFFPNNLS
ncbi:MAG: DUF4164 domain-containing protein [Spirulina sp.]